MIKKQKSSGRKKSSFALILSGGWARTLVQIGVLDILDENGIKIDYIAGSGMSAVIGGAYAMGMQPRKILEIMMEFGRKKLVGLGKLNLMNDSMFKNDVIVGLLDKIFGENKFENCHIPFRTLAIDMENAEPVVFKSGLLKEAMLAATATPFLFPPKIENGRLLMDGNITDMLPFIALKEFKPDVKMAVVVKTFSTQRDLSGSIFNHYFADKYKKSWTSRGIFRNIQDNFHLIADLGMRTLEIGGEAQMENQIIEEKPDMVIKIHTDIGYFQFSRAGEAYALGAGKMKDALAELKKRLGY